MTRDEGARQGCCRRDGRNVKGEGHAANVLPPAGIMVEDITDIDEAHVLGRRAWLLDRLMMEEASV